MKKTIIFLLSIILGSAVLMISCKTEQGGNSSGGGGTEESSDVNIEEPVIPDNLAEDASDITVTFSEGTDSCWTLENSVLTFSGLTADTICSVKGTLNGCIVVQPGDYKFELELNGLTLYSEEDAPVSFENNEKVTLTAKKDSENYIYDKRQSAEEDIPAAVYALSDLDVGGKGSLTVISLYNYGIVSKDDLSLKNLTLTVDSYDNALKGNDEAEIESGTINLISRCGDGIKTSNSKISDKGNQKGKVIVSGGIVNICAAADGIDAAYNAEISDGVLEIYTSSYSPYSGEVEATESETARYIRSTTKSYSYSVKYYNSEDDFKWVNASYKTSYSAGYETYYYYTFDYISGYDNLQFFIYSSGQSQGQEESYAYKTDYITWNSSYDTYAFNIRGNRVSSNWANYNTTTDNMTGPGGRGGMDGMSGMGTAGEGNSQKSEFSCKGIKAANEVIIAGGTITVKSYDDAVHANNTETLDNEDQPTGNVTVSGGVLTLTSNDDGIHADGVLTVSGGTVKVLSSYEGLEGNTINVAGGDINVVSSDDGFNSTLEAGTGITFAGGTTYIYAGGDGIDSNSRTRSTGIVFTGGDITVINTSGGNSSIDTENGYSYSGGRVLALCPSNAMTSECTNCSTFSSCGTYKTLNVSKGQTVKATAGTQTMSVVMPCQLNAFIVYLGSNSASISASA